MPTARNEIFRTPTVLSGDTWRYYWYIYGAHIDPLSSPTVTTVSAHLIPQDKPPVFHFAFDKLPMGLAAYDAIQQSLVISEVAGTSLYGYLTDQGQLIDYGLYANTIWMLYSDRGDDSLLDGEFQVVGGAVQIATVESKVTRASDGTETIDTVMMHLGTAVLQYLPVSAWGQYVRSFISRLNGSATPELEYTIRRRDYDDVRRDEDNVIYAVMNQRYRPHDDDHPEEAEERIYVRHLDLMTKLQDLTTALYCKLIRSASSAFSLTTTYDSDAYAIGTPYDFVTHHRQGLDTAGTVGADLVRFDRQLLCYIKQHPDEDYDPIAGLLYWGNAGIQADGWCREYTSVLDLLSDSTEHGTCKAVFRFVSGGIELRWSRCWDEVSVIASEDLPEAESGAWAVKDASAPGSDADIQVTMTTAANIHNGADVSPVLQVAGFATVKYRVDGLPDSVRPYTVKAPLTTGPCLGGSHRYWIDLPTRNAIAGKDIYTEYGRSDFGGSVGVDAVIRARSTSSINRWYYLQPSDSNGDHSGPDWIDAAEPIVMVCHNHVTHDVGAIPTAENAAGGDIQMPTLRDRFGSDFTDGPASDYEAWYSEREEPALQARQQQSDLYCTGVVIGTAFGSRKQRSITVDAERPGPFTDRDRDTLYEIDPTRFFPDHPVITDTRSIIISIESDPEAALDKIELWSPGAAEGP